MSPVINEAQVEGLSPVFGDKGGVDFFKARDSDGDVLRVEIRVSAEIVDLLKISIIGSNGAKDSSVGSDDSLAAVAPESRERALEEGGSDQNFLLRGE